MRGPRPRNLSWGRHRRGLGECGGGVSAGAQKWRPALPQAHASKPPPPSLVVLLAAVLLVFALAIPPAPEARINDYARVLTAAERERLERRAAAEERQSSNQVAIAIFPSLEGESLEDFSIRLAQQWRIGQKGLDNGVILLVFVNDRKLRIEVGYGLEGRLTDAQASAIIRNEIAPRFREQRYAAGIEAGLDAIFKAIAGEYKARTRAARKTDWTTSILFVFLGTIAFIVLVNVFAGAARRPGRMVRRGYTAGPDGWYIGSPGWGGGGGGSSGGGFSGGGGSFGGGGSSGSW